MVVAKVRDNRGSNHRASNNGHKKMTPEANTTTETTANKALEVIKEVFDLDTKADVKIKKIGDFTPVETMQEFLSRMGNNTVAILKIVNDGLEEYTKVQLAENAEIPWQLIDEDESGNEVLTPFTGTALTPKVSKSLNATVVQLAKTLFGYAKNMVAGDKEANQNAKKAAKSQALAMILSNPAAVEGLKNQK